MPSEALRYLAESWPETKNTPHAGAQWDALVARIDSLTTAHGEDRVIAAMVAWAGKTKARPSAEEFAAFTSGMYPSILKGRVRKQSRWCSREDVEYVTPHLRALDDDTKRQLGRMAGGGLPEVCEMLARDWGLKTAIEMCRRGMDINNIAALALSACGREPHEAQPTDREASPSA
jgi:hypothetical protein